MASEFEKKFYITAMKIFREAEIEREKRRVKDLKVVIAPSRNGAYLYEICITNTGKKTYTDLRFNHGDYANILLYAESFGVDTTHMPDGMAYTAGEPVVVDTLPAGATVRLTREGRGTHERYDGDRERSVRVSFQIDGSIVQREDELWCRVAVDLPNARRE